MGALGGTTPRRKGMTDFRGCSQRRHEPGDFGGTTDASSEMEERGRKERGGETVGQGIWKKRHLRVQ